MAYSNIVLQGATYPTVPGIRLPNSNNGTTYFADPGETDAVAADVASGKKFLLANGSYATGTASGGGGAAEEEHGTFTPTEDTACSAKTIVFSNTHTTIPVMWVICDAELTTFGLSANSLYYVTAVNIPDAYAHKNNNTGSYYSSGWLHYAYQNTSSNVTASSVTFRYLESSSIASLSNANKRYHPKYYVTETGLVFALGTSQIFCANRTYKWKAIW